MAKDGISVVIGTLVFIIIISIGAVITPSIMLNILLSILIVLLFFFIYFFRDPDRNSPDGNNLILSAGDGVVVGIENVVENDYLKTEAIQISVFLSVFNVHVNRVPVSGNVEFFQYKKGGFLAAYKDDASLANEQTIIGIGTDKTKILFKQIAGLIARRIVCHLREGMQVKKGERFGIIKFGSRIDMLFPKESVEIKVRLKQRVKGGETVIGVIK